MYIVAGLGNPGREYAGTKHNVGFEVLNKFAFDHNIEYKKMKFRAAVAETVLYEKKVLLCKPHTFMNLSGDSISPLMKFFGVLPENLIVVYDDADIKLGDIRIRTNGSAAGHNGIKNIIGRLGTDGFIRVRVGIDPKPQAVDMADYVLSKFKACETDAIIDGITKAGNAVEHIVKFGVSDAMNSFNRKQN